MITKNVKVKVNRNSYKHYKQLGYIFKLYDIIEIPIEHLTKGSKVKIESKCSMCGDIKEMMFKTYNYIVDRSGKYTCNICSKELSKQTNKKKYGVENVFQSDEIKLKIKQTNTSKSKTKSCCTNKRAKRQSNPSSARTYF